MADKGRHDNNHASLFLSHFNPQLATMFEGIKAAIAEHKQEKLEKEAPAGPADEKFALQGECADDPTCSPLISTTQSRDQSSTQLKVREKCTPSAVQAMLLLPMSPSL